MAKPEIWRLNAGSYPFSATIQTRFGDMDILGHINNVAMAALFENGRVQFNRSFGLPHRPGVRWLIANVDIAYVAEGRFPDDTNIVSGVRQIGASSWTIASAAFQNGVCVATADSVIVYTDAGATVPIPDDLRAKLEAHRTLLQRALWEKVQ
jgi:acyl-CoA thioester hydrolase